jgi:hypothetical protein
MTSHDSRQSFEEKKETRSAWSGPKSKKKSARKGRHSPSKSSVMPSSKSVSLTLLDALNGLRNNETKVTSEVKGLGGKVSQATSISYPPELVAAFRGLFPASREYDFQMHQVLTVSSSAGGATLGFVALSPTVASYGEWSALSSLFDEVKGISSSIDLCTTQLTTNAIGVQDMVLALDEQNISSVPASYLSVFRLAESKTFCAPLGTGGSGRHRQVRRLTPRTWCQTSAPASTSPMGGLAGCWVYGNSGLFPVSIAVFTASSITTARFRNRG